MEVQVNALGVLLAAVSSMAVGSIWYARPVLGNTWMKLAKVKMDGDKSKLVPMLALTFVLALLTAYVLAHVSYLSNSFFHNSFLQDSLASAFWLWLGLTAARIFTHDLFEGRPSKLTLITVSHELVTLLVMGLVIGLVGV
jgi:hypothetical protein